MIYLSYLRAWAGPALEGEVAIGPGIRPVGNVLFSFFSSFSLISSSLSRVMKACRRRRHDDGREGVVVSAGAGVTSLKRRP